MTIEQDIYEKTMIHPKEESKSEKKLPSCFSIVEEDCFYKQHSLVVEDMKAIYNAAIRDSVRRIKNEFSFLPKPTEHLLYVIKLIEENMIDM